MEKKTSRAVVYQTQSLARAFDRLAYYSLLEATTKRKYFVRLEFAHGERKTFVYNNSSDAHDRLLGYYRKFIRLQVAL